MAIERKRIVEKPEKKKLDKVDTKKLKRGFKPDSLPEALVEGKFVGKVGDEIVVSRSRSGKKELHICTVKQIDESGLLHTWDETIHQWFVFPANEHPEVFKIYK